MWLGDEEKEKEAITSEPHPLVPSPHSSPSCHVTFGSEPE